jgi:hypothetical protein
MVSTSLMRLGKLKQDKLANIEQIWDRIKSYGALHESQLDVKSVIHVSMMWIRRELQSTPKDSPIESRLLEKCLDVLHQIGSTPLEHYNSAIEQSKILSQLIELLGRNCSSIGALEINCQQKLSQVIKIFLRKDYVTPLDKLYDIAFNSKVITPINGQKCAVEIVEFIVKSKRFGNDLSRWKGESGLFRRTIQKIDECMNQERYAVGLQYFSLFIQVLKLNQDDTEFFYQLEQLDYIRLFSGYFSSAGTDSVPQVLDLLLELGFLGPNAESVENEFETDSPFQMEGFELPVRSANCLLVNMRVLPLYSMAYVNQIPSCSEEIQTRIFEQFLQIVQMNPRNYFEISSYSQFFSQLIEKIHLVHPNHKNVVIAIIKHVCIVLNYVPFKELSLLFVHLNGSGDLETTSQVSKCIEILIESSISWRQTLVDIGLLDILVRYFSSFGVNADDDKNLSESFGIISKLMMSLIQSESAFVMFIQRGWQSFLDLLDNADVGSQAAKLSKSILKMLFQVQPFSPSNPEVQYIVQKLRAKSPATTYLLQTLAELGAEHVSIKKDLQKNGLIHILTSLLDSVSQSIIGITFLSGWFDLLHILVDDQLENQIEFRNSIRSSKVIDFFTNVDDDGQMVVVACGLLSIAFGDKIQELSIELNGRNIKNVDSLFLLLKLMYTRQGHTDIVKSVMKLLQRAVKNSKFNKVTMANSEILEPIIAWIVAEKSKLSSLESNQCGDDSLISYLESICKEIAVYGFGEESLRVVVTAALRESFPSSVRLYLFDLLLHSLYHERTPCYFEFNPHQKSYISIEDYGRSFPPHTGYTLMGWIKLEYERDQKPQKTPILCLIDQSSQERLALFIAEDLGIYLRTQKGTTRLGKACVPLKRWFHFSIVHHKPMLTASSVDLYIDGVLDGSQKCSYLGHPGSIQSITTYIGSFGAHGYDSNAIMSLGPICFVEAYLMDAQTVSIVHDIGYEYTGNWQGSWAAYMVGNSKLQSKSTKLMDEEIQSPIFNQIATFTMSPGKSSFQHVLNIPEDSILFSLCSQNHFSNLSEHIKTELQRSDLQSQIEDCSHNVIINGAFTNPTRLSGAKCRLAKIHGDLLAVNPKRLIDGIWTLGGCAILLKFVEQSQSAEELHRTFSILAQSVTNNWRSLAEMERKQFYELLSFILKRKTEFLTISLLDLVFLLVISNEDMNDQSICNPNALKHLVLDIELWRNSLDIQRYYLRHLTDLMVHSKHREENIHTLNKMGILL